jgi:hypothetical protein
MGAERRKPVGATEQFGQCGRQRHRVARGNGQSIAAGGDRIGQLSDRAGDHRKPRLHRFMRADTQPLGS